MTKKELEIRLKVAESIIKECEESLTNENIQKLAEEKSISFGDACVRLNGFVSAHLNYYEDRATQAIDRDGRDIYSKH